LLPADRGGDTGDEGRARASARRIFRRWFLRLRGMRSCQAGRKDMGMIWLWIHY
jgi:hypothetical protein